MNGLLTFFDIGKEGGDFTVELTAKIENDVIEVLDCKRYKYKKEHELLKNTFKSKLLEDNNE